MRIRSLAFGAFLACAAPVAAGAADSGYEPVAKVNVGFENTADRLWSGSMAMPACSRPNQRRRLMSFFAGPQPLASQERHGELIGEFVGPQPIAQSVRDQARDCAALAGDKTTARLMLAGGPSGLSRFQRAFKACMAKQDAPQAVGSMTLWIDSHCNF